MNKFKLNSKFLNDKPFQMRVTENLLRVNKFYEKLEYAK
jgi:hypothetical protein